MIKVNDAYELYKADPSQENKEQLGGSLFSYCDAFLKKNYCHDGATYHTVRDAIGETILRVWRDFEQYDPTKGCQFKTWVTIMLKSDVVDILRAYGTRNEIGISDNQ